MASSSGTISRRIALIVALVVLVIGAIVVFALGDGSPASRSYGASFDADRTTLVGAKFANGSTWQVEGGAFSVKGGTAAGSRSGPGPAFATVDVRAPLRSITGTYAHIEGSSGIVYRYINDKNYWSVVAVPEYGTWNLNKTVNAQTAFVANTGSNLATDNGSIRVELSGDTMTVIVDGKPSMRVTDSALSRGTRAGLVAGPNDQGGTRWIALQLSAA